MRIGWSYQRLFKRAHFGTWVRHCTHRAHNHKGYT